MPTEITLVSAFLVGLLGSTHCLGMCGGIVGALTLGVAPDVRQRPAQLFPYLLSYNVGRIASYAAAGALAGGLSARVLDLLSPPQAHLIAKLFSGGFMIALGLYLAGWWPGLTALEKLGGYLWRRLEPLGRRLLPVHNPVQALGVGLVWGWLPCGLVYSALAFALASGTAVNGAALMAAFGLGTLPMLLAMGALARWLGHVVHLPWVRRTAGVLILLFGLYTLFVPDAHSGYFGEHAGHAYPPK